MNYSKQKKVKVHRLKRRFKSAILHYFTPEMTLSYHLKLIQCLQVTKRSSVQIAVQIFVIY